MSRSTALRERRKGFSPPLTPASYLFMAIPRAPHERRRFSRRPGL